MKFVRDALRSKRGAVAVMFALMLPVVIGAAGLGVETTYWFIKQRQLQAQADAAAYAGALEKRTGSSNTLVTNEATRVAQDNGFTTGTITVNTPPTSGPNTGTTAVEVILTSTAERFFTTFFTNAPVNLYARGVGKYNTASNACILALNTTASKAAMFSGNTNLTLTGCSVMTNSSAADAGIVQGSALLSTTCLISSGGVSVTSGLTETVCTAPITQATPAADPYALVPQPTQPSGGCQSDSGTTRSPGRYCHGMDLKNNVALAAGVYYVEGGDFNVNANANVSGSDVTIFVTSGNHVTMNGNSTTVLSAPTTGTYKGILFFGDRTGTGINKINGNNSSLLTGATYFPSQAVQYLGNFSGQGGCGQVIGDTVDWTGSTTVAVDCSAYGMSTIAAYTIVKLVE